MSYCYIDDQSIQSEDLLLRRIKLNMICFDRHFNRLRPRSTAFKDSDSDLDLLESIVKELSLVNLDYDPKGKKTPMSTYIQSVLLAHGQREVDILDGFPDFVLVGISVDTIRQIAIKRNFSQRIIRQPRATPPEYEIAHAWVAGNKSGALRDDLTNASRWLTRPSNEWINLNRESLGIPANLTPEDLFSVPTS